MALLKFEEYQPERKPIVEMQEEIAIACDEDADEVVDGIEKAFSNAKKADKKDKKEILESIKNKIDDVLKYYQTNEAMSVSPAGKLEGDRKLSDIAKDVYADWKRVAPEAEAYLDPMSTLNTLEDEYGADSAASVVAYFLSNAKSWHGDKAKAIKAELNAMLKEYYKK